MVPTPFLLSTVTVPFILSIRCLTMDIPSPVPWVTLFLSVFSREKGSNRWGRNAGLMPIPLSEITVWQDIRFSPIAFIVTWHRTYPPASVYLIAFPKILIKICLTCRELPSTQPTAVPSVCSSYFKRTPLSAARGSTIVIISCQSSFKQNGSFVSWRFSSSSLLNSSTSLINSSRCFAATFSFARFASTSALSSLWRSLISIIPIMPFNGVRISCDIRDKNPVFAAFARSAASFACFNSSSFLSIAAIERSVI